jgi:hypothetical protein
MCSKSAVKGGGVPLAEDQLPTPEPKMRFFFPASQFAALRQTIRFGILAIGCSGALIASGAKNLATSAAIAATEVDPKFDETRRIRAKEAREVEEQEFKRWALRLLW